MVIIRNLLRTLHSRVDEVGHAIGRRYREPSRIEQVGWPKASARDLYEAANALTSIPGNTVVADWLRDVARAGNGYLKPSGFTLDELERMRHAIERAPWL